MADWVYPCLIKKRYMADSLASEKTNVELFMKGGKKWQIQ